MRKAISRAIRRASFGLLRHLSPRAEYAGIQLISLVETADADWIFARIRDALRLVQDVDARRFMRVQRHVSTIVIVETGGASYLPEIRGCFLETAMLYRDPLSLAAELVHESTHGHLYTKGFRYTERTRSREELICVDETVRFLSRTPSGAELAEQLRLQVERELSLDHPWFSSKRQRARSDRISLYYSLPRPLRALRRFMDG